MRFSVDNAIFDQVGAGPVTFGANVGISAMKVKLDVIIYDSSAACVCVSIFEYPNVAYLSNELIA